MNRRATLFRVKMLSPRSLALLGLVTALLAAPPARAADKIRLLIVTGGHPFETNQFFEIFRTDTNLTFEAVEHPRAHVWLDPDTAKRFDVLVLYDLWQDINGAAKTNFMKWTAKGKGIVALHHCLANYQAWDEYARLIGGKYYLENTVVAGVNRPQSTFLHGVRFHVRVADPNHPVTRGVQDFDIVDETYGRLEVHPSVHALLTTDTPTSNRIIGWTQTYGKARVVYVQLGHDHTAYENPNYHRLVLQAIRWAANKD